MSNMTETLFLKNKVKKLFKIGDQRVRVTDSAKPLVNQYINDVIRRGVAKLIDQLPRKSMGNNKGQLKRVTIKKSDIEKILTEFAG